MSPTATEVQNQNQSASGTATGPTAQRLSLENVEEAFTNQPLNDDQVERGKVVAAALTAAAKTILQNVPECPTRTRALNHLVDGRMLADEAIAQEGRF